MIRTIQRTFQSTIQELEFMKNSNILNCSLGDLPLFVHIPHIEGLVSVSELDLIQHHEMMNWVHSKLRENCYLTLTGDDYLII